MKLKRPTGTEQAERQTLCPDCGVAHEQDDSGNPRCLDCRPAEALRLERNRHRDKTTAERGYGWRWQKLSKRARAQQDFCSDCGSPEDLTADHSMEAWRRHDQGKTIRLQDIDVVCIRCNTERGAARGITATDLYRQSNAERLARIQSDSEL
jgi:5-methylcytosine-specific restriction enzyme A